jgi:hypothetical protein
MVLCPFVLAILSVTAMDVLKHLHLYIAFGEQVLYVAPADAVAQVIPAKP